MIVLKLINMSKIVAIVSSPRAKGQGNAIVEKMIEAAKANGNEVETFYINKLENLTGCQACMGCKKKGKCIRKDSLTPVLDAVAEADSLILSAADYFGQPCAQYRMFEDRCFSFLGGDFIPNIAAGKKVAIVVTCGSGLDGANRIADAIEGEWTNFFKGNVVGKIVRGGLMEPTAASENKEIMDEAKALGQKL